MRNISYLLITLLLAVSAHGQLLSWSPSFITDTSSKIVIICDATQGNKGLNNYSNSSNVYVHIGLTTSAGDWQHIASSTPGSNPWGTTDAKLLTTYLGNNKWQYTITGGLRNFFGVTNSSENIYKIAILFRNADGSIKQTNTDGSDMYIPVYAKGSFNVRLDLPARQPLSTPALEPVTKKAGDNISITANASQSSNITLFFNGTQIASASNAQTVSANPVITAIGTQTIIAQANNGTITVSDTSTFFISGNNSFVALPNGVSDGINYESGDTSVTLVLYAPNKTQVTVVGDFNNWTQSSSYQMNETPDSLRYWIRLTGLTPGVEYAYQYIIDGSLQVADYNAEKILDNANDSYIDAATYPNLKPFPVKASGNIVSVLQTAKPAYNWQVTNFNRPDKHNLSIYELWVGNFTAAHNYQALIDTLSYLKRLGINAVELMPVNEFEGNVSWGYNPNFYFALDKYYGTENKFKELIDVCHQNGMAVIMDMVLNHSFGSSPMVQMYWNSASSIPAANSPWFSPYYTHPFNVGYQFNNASNATMDFRKRVIAYWLKNYHIDGYRFDLAGGFTTVNSCDATGNNCNETTWDNFDQSRINIWDSLYTYQQSVSQNSYTVLEIFVNNSEETIEANAGMLLWGNLNSQFNQATMGYSNPSWDLSSGVYTNRGWNQPNLVTYQESHDEERLMYKNEMYGNSSGSYNIKDTATGLKRNAMAAAFFTMMPGPKMIWQFGELGYDYSINSCGGSNASTNDNCRTDPKPLGWAYYNNANRKALYNVYSKLLALRNTSNYINTFTTGNVSFNLSAAFKTLTLTSDSLKVVVIGNFDVAAQTATVTFPYAGYWFSYLDNQYHLGTGNAESITLQPGEFYVYLNKNLNGTVITAVDNLANNNASGMEIKIYPNPLQASSVVRFSLPENGNTNMMVYDLSGKKIADLYDGFKPKGTGTITISKNIFPQSGTYFLRIEQNGKSKTEKFLVAN